MNHDDIIQEVRTIREQLAASHGYNVRALFAEAKKRQKESGREVVKTTDADIARQREIARRMREARDKMPPLGMSIKEMVEDGRM